MFYTSNILYNSLDINMCEANTNFLTNLHPIVQISHMPGADRRNVQSKKEKAGVRKSSNGFLLSQFNCCRTTKGPNRSPVPQ